MSIPFVSRHEVVENLSRLPRAIVAAWAGELYRSIPEEMRMLEGWCQEPFPQEFWDAVNVPNTDTQRLRLAVTQAQPWYPFANHPMLQSIPMKTPTRYRQIGWKSKSFPTQTEDELRAEVHVQSPIGDWFRIAYEPIQTSVIKIEEREIPSSCHRVDTECGKSDFFFGAIPESAIAQLFPGEFWLNVYAIADWQANEGTLIPRTVEARTMTTPIRGQEYWSVL